MIARVLVGCIDQISFDSEQSEGQLVVSGKIHDGPGPYTLELGMTTTESTLPLPESGASITLFNDQGQQEQYIHTGAGTYRLAGDVITGTRGHTYHIEIELKDGQSFSSLPETIPLHTAEIEVILEPGTYEEQTDRGTVVEREGVYMYANTEIPNHENPIFLKWDIESMYLFREAESAHPLGPQAETCYVTEVTNPQSISLFSTVNTNSSVIEQQLLGIKDIVSYKFYSRHYFNVIVSSISERRYNYWQKVDDMINQTGTIFDIPPATIPGNIQNDNGELADAFGYFEASATDTARAFTTPADFSLYIPNPCSHPRGSLENHNGCNGCLILENSTLERPSYLQ